MLTNQKRDKYYGTRIGDIVTSKSQFKGTAEVIEYGLKDNNRVTVKINDRKISVVAERLTIVEKVEQRLSERIVRVLQILDLPEYNNCAIAGQYIIELITEFGTSLPEIEQILRQLNSRVYLIGLSLPIFNNPKFTSKLPYCKKEYPYGLWIELNGKEALNKFTATDTDISLKKTGFLFERELCGPPLHIKAKILKCKKETGKIMLKKKKRP